MFKGDIHRCEHLHDGTDWRTTLYLGDGLDAWQESLINQSFSEGVDVKELLKKALGSLKGVDTSGALQEIDSFETSKL
ncbi:hypothetical protein GN156_36240, partial [bacterium LRH843]|nr:hypothetical protein [bacterium LRH843]